MHLAVEEVEGIVLFYRRHRERDYLVKIFTDKYGKLMFFVRGQKNPNWNLKPLIQPFVRVTLIADIRQEGLSFVRDLKDVRVARKTQADLHLNAYLTYILSLADAAVEDRIAYQGLFRELWRAIDHIEAGKDVEVITFIFEIKMLYYFGVVQEWRGCVVCGDMDGPFDYSSIYNGLLCHEHWHLDSRRFHLSQKAIYFLRLFSHVSMEKLGDINVSSETKREMRHVIDKIYEENVGVHPKSKTFIDKMHRFENNLFKKDKSTSSKDGP